MCAGPADAEGKRTCLGAGTACDPGWFSHRARRDEARFATAAWLGA